MTWIRWDCGAAQSGIFHELSVKTRLSPAAALGHYIAMCEGFGTHQPDGRIADVSDDVLELWSMWQGKRGEWAKAVRARCTDTSGALRGWWRNEAVLRKQYNDARKPSGSRKHPAPDASESPENPPEIPRGILAGNEDEDVTVRSSSPSSGGAAMAKLVTRLQSHPRRHDVAALMEALPDGYSPDVWARVVDNILDGLGMPGLKPATVEQLIVGWNAYLLSLPAKPAEKWFRSCVANADLNLIDTGKHQPSAGSRPSASDRAAAMIQKGAA
jgi:hypothetical protein